MRQFVLGTGLVTSGTVDGNNTSNLGKLAVAYLNKSNNKLTFVDASAAKNIVNQGEGYLVLLRSDDDGGNVVLPIHANHFTYVKGTYDASKYDFYTNGFKVPEVDAYLDYTVIIVKKGKGFNERNKWTATVHSKESDTAATIATKLAQQINANIGADVVATVGGDDDDEITITGKTKGIDYAIVLADELYGVALTTTDGSDTVMFPYGDAKYVTDLANKACADAGFEYTYDDSPQLLYPKYPLNPLAAADSSDTGFTIYTLRFAEPRDVKTRDEVVHQIVQVAFPTSADGAFENICKQIQQFLS